MHKSRGLTTALMARETAPGGRERPPVVGAAGAGRERPRPTAAAGAGAVLTLIREGRASTRSELIAMTGLARSTVTQRLDQLLAERLVVPAGEGASTGGGPPRRVAFQPRAGEGPPRGLGATPSQAAHPNPRGGCPAPPAAVLPP